MAVKAEVEQVMIWAVKHSLIHKLGGYVVDIITSTT